MKPLRIGTRGSPLALAQTRIVTDRIRRLFPGIEIEQRVVRTTGDRFSRAALSRLAGQSKGLFVKEIEEALLEKAIDLAVHSLKDLPAQLPPGLHLAAFPERETATDAFVSFLPCKSISELPDRARVGTGSLRRRIQLLALRPDLEIVPIRGNIRTRLDRIRREALAGVVLAAAGLTRLGLEDRIAFEFGPDEMVPAVGQGALAIEVRRNDRRVLEVAESLDHPGTRTAVEAERAFLAAMGGGCQVPMGAHVRPVDDGFEVTAFAAEENGASLERFRSRCSLQELSRTIEKAVRRLQETGSAESGKPIEGRR